MYYSHGALIRSRYNPASALELPSVDVGGRPSPDPPTDGKDKWPSPSHNTVLKVVAGRPRVTDDLAHLGHEHDTSETPAGF